MLRSLYCFDSRFLVDLSLDVPGDGHEGLLVDPGVARLVEGQDPHAEAGVLLDNLVSLLVGVEGVHENERHVGVVLLVQALDLAKRLFGSSKTQE